MKTRDTMTDGQRLLYAFHRAEAKRRVRLAREYDEQDRPSLAIHYRERASEELAHAKKIRDQAKALLTRTDAAAIEEAAGAPVTSEQISAAATVECAYCLADVAERGDAMPAVDNDDAWTTLAAEHQPGCEWTETRAHRIPAILGRLAREIRAGGIAMSEAAAQLALGRLYRVDTLSAGHDCVVDADSADGALTTVAEYADRLVGERLPAGWSAAQVVA